MIFQVGSPNVMAEYICWTQRKSHFFEQYKNVFLSVTALTGPSCLSTEWVLSLLSNIPHTMCGVYVVLGLSWLNVCHFTGEASSGFGSGLVSFACLTWTLPGERCCWKNRKYGRSLNRCLQATEGLVLAAEVVSSGKRTLARMWVLFFIIWNFTFSTISVSVFVPFIFSGRLVIIVSLGFGIVKPRLGRWGVPRNV